MKGDGAREYPEGSVRADDPLKVGELLILVYAMAWGTPQLEAVTCEDGGSVRPTGSKGFLHHLARMPRPWAIFRVDPARSGRTSTRSDPRAVAYLNALRLREAARLRLEADKLEALAQQGDGHA